MTGNLSFTGSLPSALLIWSLRVFNDVSPQDLLNFITRFTMTIRINENKQPDAMTCQYVPPEHHIPTLEEDVRNGMLERPRSLPPKYFYDDYGSRLFDQICDTPEYYVTRTEDALLCANALDIMAKSQPDHIIEFGSGTSRKTRRLLDACVRNDQVCTYWPFEVCESALLAAAQELIRDYRWLSINALLGDYLAGLKHLPKPKGRCLFTFLGSTIGNFERRQTIEFLTQLRQQMRSQDTLLLGADRDKDIKVLQAAYNDTQGVTSQFNLNVLRVLNREMNANFDLAAYRHLAYYNRDRRQIEMYLIASRTQVVEIRELGEEIQLMSGERILTEISRKFTFEELEDILQLSGFKLLTHYEPLNRYFSLLLAQPQ